MASMPARCRVATNQELFLAYPEIAELCLRAGIDRQPELVTLCPFIIHVALYTYVIN